MSDTRVPQKDSEFDTYIRTSTALLEAGSPTGAVRLGLSTTQANQWIAYRDQWIITYPLFADKGTRTTGIKNDKNALKKNFTTFSRVPLKQIEISPALTNTDRETLHLPIPDTTPTARGPINEKPSGSLNGIGGAKLEVRARQTTDATRSSMHPLADAVEFKYALVDAGKAPSEGGGEGGDPPKNIPTPKECPETISSKAAMFHILLPEDAPGKRVIGYLRWVNLTNPANNSGWSDFLTTIIS